MPPTTPTWAVAAAATTAVTVAIYAIVRNHFLKSVLPTLTALSDLPTLGEEGKRKGRHAVVVGGSWSGLLSARVLLSHFDTVTVLETEKIDLDSTDPRTHVAQYLCNHILQAMGLAVAEKLFPGIGSECIKAGAWDMDFASDCRFHSFSGRQIMLDALGQDTSAKPTRDRVPSLCCSRGLLERTVRARLLREFGPSGRLTYRSGVTVASMTIGPDGKVSGVTCQVKKGDEETVSVAETIEADAVIDATGRAARGLRWLGAAADAIPHPEGERGYFTFINSDAVTNPHRACMLQRIEGTSTSLTSTSGSRARATKPFLEERGATLKEFKVTRTAVSKRIRYDQAKNLPEGFFAVGDAVISVNPIYGQGLTLSAVSVSSLDRALRDSATIAAAGPAYFKLQESRLLMAWLIPAGLDWRYPAVKPYAGAPVAAAENIAWMVQHLTRVSQVDDSMTIFFWRTIAMVSWPTEMLSLRLWFSIFKSHFTSLVTAKA
ncbi:hypothetical protein HK101_002333 [Irineochytrium annulatum]|nr:hypothetical protein HK101_002333 [Irineochytrium annulatum]